MSRFLQALHSGRVLLMDGAMGTELQRAGIGEKECYEAWNLTHPEKVRKIHQAYVLAGAECLLTNTFQSNHSFLAKHGIGEKLEEINEAALAIAHSVCGQRQFVLADIGPLEPVDFAAVVRSLRKADALLLETWSDSLAFDLARRAGGNELNHDGMPVLLSFSFRPNPVFGKPPRLYQGGLTPEQVAQKAESCGLAALGVNCGRDLTLKDLIDILRRYRSKSDLPLFVRPNAGTPRRVNNRWVYPWTPEILVERLPEILETGVQMIGGCCGTTPEHITAFRGIIDQWNGPLEKPSFEDSQSK